MNPPANSPSPGPSPVRALAAQADNLLGTLLAQSLTQYLQTAQASANLTALALRRPDPITPAPASSPSYNVFNTGTTEPRSTVLRNVTQLNGQPPTTTYPSFDAALAQCNQQLTIDVSDRLPDPPARRRK